MTRPTKYEFPSGYTKDESSNRLWAYLPDLLSMRLIFPISPLNPKNRAGQKTSRFGLAILAVSLTATAAFGQSNLGPANIGAKALVPNNRWAMVIGVSNYLPEIGPLRFTAKEAREVAGTLKSELQFQPENLKLLANGGTADEAPTSANIIKSLDELLQDKRLDKANLFIFYFSGHGVGTPKGDFLLPADTRKDQVEQMGVPVRTVIEKIVRAGLKNVLFIADACRAGTKNDFGEDLTALCHKANIAVILGCAPGMRSYEYSALQEGAFTHFLLEGLKKPGLRDFTGSLWASKLGEDLQKSVHDYTEVDHGKFAQTPALWGDSSTLDVLLAAYPQPPISDSAVKSFELKAKTLNRQDFSAAVTTYAISLFEGDRYDQAAELLKTVDQLGELTPLASIVLASSLDSLGRTGEAERVYATFQSQPEGYWKDFALSTSCSRDLDPAIRINAAKKLFATEFEWNMKVMAYGVVARWGTYEEKLNLAKQLLATKSTTQRQTLYASAQVASLEGRWSDSVRALNLAMSSPGNSPTDFIIYLAKLEPLLRLGNAQALDKYLAEPNLDRRNSGFAFVERAKLAKNKGDVPGRIKYLKIALAMHLYPEFLFLAAKVAGPYIGSLQEEFKTAALEYPYSWRARLVLYLVRKIQGDPNLEKEGQAADRFMDDPLTFNSQLFEFMDLFMIEAVQLGRIPMETYRSQTDLYFLLLKDSASKFGYDADIWMQFAKYGMFNERNAQVNQVVSRFLKFTPESAPRSLRPMLLFLAMNRGDTQSVEKLFKGNYEPIEAQDPSWVYASYEATIGNASRARLLINKLGPSSPELAGRMDALRTYLLVESGSATKARLRLAKPSSDIIVQAWNGLSWAALGNWKQAEPLLKRQVADRDWSFLFVQNFAIHCLNQHYLKTNRFKEAREIAFSAMISQPGNPLFDQYSFAVKPGLPQFAGIIQMKSQAIDDKDPNLEGMLTVDINPWGVFQGQFTTDDGKQFLFKGTLDAHGNVSGTSNWNGRKCHLTGKLAPPLLYKTYPGFKNPGQELQLVDEEGFRIVILGKTT